MTTATQSLANFLLARLADDEAVARAAAEAVKWAATDVWHSERDWTRVSPDYTVVSATTRTIFSSNEDDDGRQIGVATEAETTHIARHDPARVLAEVEAKRAIVEAASDDETLLSGARPMVDEDDFLSGTDQMYAVVLRHLAAPYASHEDYQAEWSA